MYTCIHACTQRKNRASWSKRRNMGGTYHCVNSGAFLVLGHLRSSWCIVGRGTGQKSEEHCLHFLLTLEQLLFASHCNSTSNGLADSAHSDTRCHRTCKGIYPLQDKTQGHISCCRFGGKAVLSSIFPRECSQVLNQAIAR